MKKTITAGVTALALTLAGCGETESTTPATTSATTATTAEKASETSATPTSQNDAPTPAAAPTPTFNSAEWGYAPYGYDEYGLPHVPDHATDFERCSMLAGMECTDQMMSEWQAVNDYASTQQERNDGHSWWGECIAENTAEYCRANDPWQQ